MLLFGKYDFMQVLYLVGFTPKLISSVILDYGDVPIAVVDGYAYGAARTISKSARNFVFPFYLFHLSVNANGKRLSAKQPRKDPLLPKVHISVIERCTLGLKQAKYLSK